MWTGGQEAPQHGTRGPPNAPLPQGLLPRDHCPLKPALLPSAAVAMRARVNMAKASGTALHDASLPHHRSSMPVKFSRSRLIAHRTRSRSCGCPLRRVSSALHHRRWKRLKTRGLSRMRPPTSPPTAFNATHTYISLITSLPLPPLRWARAGYTQRGPRTCNSTDSPPCTGMTTTTIVATTEAGQAGMVGTGARRRSSGFQCKAK